MKKETLGELAILAACLLVYPCASVLVKVVAGQGSGLLISFWRFLIGAILSISLMFLWEKPWAIRQWRTWILRGLFGAGAMMAGYISIQMTSSGRAVLLANTYPVFVAMFGVAFFKEKIVWHQWAALVFCMLGVLLVFRDHSQYSLLGNAIGLLSGMLGGLAVHYLKKSRECNSPSCVYLSACLFGVLPGLTVLPQMVKHFPAPVWVFLALIGVLAFVGQWLSAYGFKYVTATTGSIMGFAETLVTISLSWLFLGEEMRGRFLVGALLILAGLLINQKFLIRRIHPALT